MSSHTISTPASTSGVVNIGGHNIPDMTFAAIVTGSILGFSLLLFLLIGYYQGTLPGMRQCPICGRRIDGKPDWCKGLAFKVQRVGVMVPECHTKCAQLWEQKGRGLPAKCRVPEVKTQWSQRTEYGRVNSQNKYEAHNSPKVGKWVDETGQEVDGKTGQRLKKLYETGHEVDGKTGQRLKSKKERSANK